MQKKLLAPSLLSADFSKLAQEVKSVEEGGADWIHIDVMDGHFVPNLTFGPLVVKALKPHTPLPLDCHLMVSEPEKWIESFAEAGADIITVHAEASAHLHRLVQQIRATGCKVGVSVNPATPLSALEEILPQIDLVLVMSVNPGFGGQEFIESSLGKIQKLHAMQTRMQQESPHKDKKGFLIEVDGGVSSKNIRRLSDAGAQVFVAGSAVFSQTNRKGALDLLRAELVGAK